MKPETLKIMRDMFLKVEVASIERTFAKDASKDIDGRIITMSLGLGYCSAIENILSAEIGAAEAKNLILDWKDEAVKMARTEAVK